jgi:hypothetical protein
MGEMKTTIYTAIATRDGDQVRFLLQDPAKRRVAEGTGATVSAAQENALEKAADDSAKMHLRQMKYPESLAD